MNKKTFIFFLSFLICVKTFSQVPGYMGKRCSIIYSGWAHPALKPFTDFFGASNPYDDISLNVSQALELDYTVSKRGTLCLGFQYSYLGMGYEVEGSYAEYIYKGKDKFPARLISRGFSLGYKLFPRGRIAPVGTYIKWDILGLFNTLKYSTEGAFQRVYGQNSMGNGVYSFVPVTAAAEKINSSGFGVAISFGRQRVFANRIIIDSGIRFAIAIAGDPYSSSGYGNQFKVTDRVFFNQIVNLRLGIGFLAF